MSKKVTIEPLSGQRQSGESSKAVQACNDYLRMGSGRSLRSLLDDYRSLQKNAAFTRSYDTLMRWSSNFKWAERAELYDTRLEDEKNRRADEIMSSGLALIHERTQKLKELYDLLEKQLFEEGENGDLCNLWVQDVKQIGQGEFAERVDIERYNSALIGDIRGILEDLAKETGGRAARQDNLQIELSGLTTKQLERLARGENLYAVLATPGES